MKPGRIALRLLSIAVFAFVMYQGEHKQEATKYANLANADFTAENYSQCVQDASKALSIDPDHRLALVMRGEGYRYLHELDLSQADLLRATTVAPSDGLAWEQLGITQYVLGDLEQARSNLSKALVLKPSLKYTYLFLGLVDACQDNWPAAQPSFQSFLATASSSSLDEADRSLSAAIRRHPTSTALMQANRMVLDARKNGSLGSAP